MLVLDGKVGQFTVVISKVAGTADLLTEDAWLLPTGGYYMPRSGGFATFWWHDRTCNHELPASEAAADAAKAASL